MIRISTLAAALFGLLALSPPAQAQWNNDAEKCSKDEVTYRQKIHYCTLALSSGQLSQVNMANTYFNRGVAYDGHGELEKAVEDFSQAIALKPEDADFYLNRGVSYLELGEGEKGVADFDKAVELRPEDPGLRFNRGVLLEQLGRPDAAREDYVRAYALAPEVPEIKAKAEELGLTQ